MKKLIERLIIVSCLVGIIVSCGPSQEQYDALLKENESLKSEVSNLNAALDVLKNEIEQYKTTPDILYAEAQKCIDSKDIDGLNAVISKFDKYHPASQEAQNAKAALVKLI